MFLALKVSDRPMRTLLLRISVVSSRADLGTAAVVPRVGLFVRASKALKVVPIRVLGGALVLIETARGISPRVALLLRI